MGSTCGEIRRGKTGEICRSRIFVGKAGQICGQQGILPAHNGPCVQVFLAIRPLLSVYIWHAQASAFVLIIVTALIFRNGVRGNV